MTPHSRRMDRPSRQRPRRKHSGRRDAPLSLPRPKHNATHQERASTDSRGTRTPKRDMAHIPGLQAKPKPTKSTLSRKPPVRHQHGEKNARRASPPSAAHILALPADLPVQTGYNAVLQLHAECAGCGGWGDKFRRELPGRGSSCAC